MLSILLAAAVATSDFKTVLSVPLDHALVEGVATDGRTIWVSSVLDRTILACKASCDILATLPAGLHPLGIAWDKRKHRIWVAADCPAVPGAVKCAKGALVSIDTRGRVRKRLQPDVPAFHPGDVSATTKGVFVSDSQNGAVYRLSDRARLAAVVPAGVGRSAQGSALDEHGARLVVADYGQGITLIDLATNARKLLLPEGGEAQRGLDGLVRCGNAYFAIDNASAPARLLRFTIVGDSVRMDPIIIGGPLVDPTQIAVDRNRLLLVANAGWEGALGGKPRESTTPIVAVPIGHRCDG